MAEWDFWHHETTNRGSIPAVANLSCIPFSWVSKVFKGCEAIITQLKHKKTQNWGVILRRKREKEKHECSSDPRCKNLLKLDSKPLKSTKNSEKLIFPKFWKRCPDGRVGFSKEHVPRRPTGVRSPRWQIFFALFFLGF